MPRNSRCRSRGSKTLVDISNGAQMARTSEKETHGDGSGSSRHPLLHAPADLSKLINQIDELVMQALEHKFTIEKNQEIEAFIHVLSDMHSSLKSWIPRFERAFGNLEVGPGNQLELSQDNKTFSAVDGGKKIISNCPSEPELGLIVSPSPLVSWRNGASTVESGRQLFLPTPLHDSKSLAAKFSGSSKCFQGRLNNRNGSCSSLGMATFSNAPCCNCCNLMGIFDVKPTPNKFLVHQMQDNKIVRKGTPWVARIQRNNASLVSDTLSSGKYSQNCGSDEISITLTSKYPELFGQPPAQNSTVRRKEVDETLDWFLSPPKTCVLMEPLDEKVALPSGRDKYPLNSRNNNSKLAGPEATPMWKDLESTAANGKNAGEATLKRELWTKFEAVSTKGLQLDHSIFEQISRNRFLDMLEEVS